MQQPEFSPLTPFHHPALDTWGLAKRTRVWMADGGYLPVDEVRPGDHVLGLSFHIERDYLPRHEDPHHESNFVQVRRPVLTARRVLGVREVQARPWQVTFGDAEAQAETRRLVCGADTQIVRFPLSGRETLTRRVVDCPTALENPRVATQTMEAKQLDEEASHAHGEAVYRPTQFSGQARGEMLVTVPYEAYGGQMKMLRTDVRPYNRYLYSQVREVVPLTESYPLYQLALQPDTDPKSGAPLRCNCIVQTPFKPGSKKRRVMADHLSRARMETEDWGQYMAEWDSWVNQKQRGASAPDQAKPVDYESESQGQHYLAQEPGMARELEAQYGLKGGFLNGGILVEVPVSLHATLGAGADSVPEVHYQFNG